MELATLSSSFVSRYYSWLVSFYWNYSSCFASIFYLLLIRYYLINKGEEDLTLPLLQLFVAFSKPIYYMQLSQINNLGFVLILDSV